MGSKKRTELSAAELEDQLFVQGCAAPPRPPVAIAIAPPAPAVPSREPPPLLRVIPPAGVGRARPVPPGPLPKPLVTPAEVVMNHPVPASPSAPARRPPEMVEDLGERQAVVDRIFSEKGYLFLVAKPPEQRIFAQLKRFVFANPGEILREGDVVHCLIGRQRDGRLRLTEVISVSRKGATLGLSRSSGS